MDRQRLADALAYEQERRSRLAKVVPMPSDGQPEVAPTPSLRSNVENLSIGLGEGLTNQLEGVKALVTDPIGTAKNAYEGVIAAARDPSILADALRYTAEQATSGPLGFGQVAGEMLGPMRGRPSPDMLELDVYHGTPHRFPATEANPLGEFDASKIGTGEGAQAYGHGVYLAESPKVAQGYATGIPYRDFERKVAEVYNEFDSPDEAMIALKEAGLSEVQMKVVKALEKDDWLGFDYPHQALRAALKEPKNFDLSNETKSVLQNISSIYKADLPDKMIDRMLDWDKPIKDQPTVLQSIRATLPDDVQKDFDANVQGGISGGNAYLNWVWGAKSAAQKSEKLKEAGIPGIKYADAGSRGQGGSGTRNFVVFPGEEKNVRILERDGQKAPPQKIAQALEAAPDYRMNHRPLKVENGAAQLNKAYEVFGQDIYGPNALQYFGGGDPRETKTVAALKRLRDNPDAEVTIYRGVPADATGGIAKGDWVTLDKDVAQDYANLKPGQKGKVLTMKVKAKDVTTWPDSLLEFGYYPAD
jgi:hypothetical protein